VGYWVRTSRSGNGFIYEAVTAMTAYAFRQLRAVRVELVTDEDNSASRKVAERCQFRLEGILHHERRAPDGTLVNTCIYARLPPAS
jgi:RimJ/RimL family protein N-acetyltransferase